MSRKYTFLFLLVITMGTVLAFLDGPQNKQKRILIYTKNGEGFVHKNIPHSTKVK